MRFVWKVVLLSAGGWMCGWIVGKFGGGKLEAILLYLAMLSVSIGVGL